MAKNNKETKRKRGRPPKEESINQTYEKKKMSKAGSIAWLIVFIALFFFALTKGGPAGIIANNILSFIFGNYYFVVLLTLLFFFVKVLFSKKNSAFPLNIYIGIVILNLSIMMLSSLIANSNAGISFDKFSELFSNLKLINSDTVSFEGGLVGTFLYAFFSSCFDSTGALISLIVLFIICAVLIIPLNYFVKAARASRNAVINTANTIGEVKIQKDERKRIDSERQTELDAQRVIDSLQNNNDVQEIINESSQEANNNDDDEPNYVDNPNSEFVKNYFMDADNVSREEEVTLPEEESFDEKDNYIEAEGPSISKNIQVNLEDANEPKLTEAPKTLRRQSSFRGYKLPKADELLSKALGSKSNKNETTAEARGLELIKILSNFGIKATLSEYHIGPSVTKFEIKPDATVNLSKINSLSDNIKMGLAAKSIRIEAPIPGKNAVGVEVPNVENSPVRMSELISSVPKDKASKKLLFALGKDLSGKPEFCDLAKMPHLLIAGATGSGKSVCINTIITSYLLRTKPDEVKMILVDPKKVEFTPYHDIPHLLWPVITDAKTASLMLKKMVVMMEERYDAFAKAAVRDIISYNEKVVEHNKNLKQDEQPMVKLPYIVVIIDELADLMQTSKQDVESSITRITQLARASGIHLIVATQRPSTDVITGLIKSNIPSRISFAVSSAIDSRTILDSAGAEELLGNGDMLYSPQGENVPKRLQGCWVTDSEIEHITSFCKTQAQPEYDDTYFALKNNSESGGSNATSGEEDSLYEEAKEFIAKSKKASTSSLQRRFGIGYNRAARLIDTFEQNGLIGPANGAKPREVYIKSQDEQN